MKNVITALLLCISIGATAQTMGNPMPNVSAEENPLQTINNTPGLCAIFRTWGFIGDSLCSGEMESRDENGKLGHHDMYEYSWGQFLCRACGAEGENFSRGGQTAKGWIADDTKRGWAYCKMNPKQAYIVAMGVNDYTRRKRNNLKCGSLDTDVDLKDYNNNAPTYAGYMAGIIQRLQSIQPKAKIFVVTRPQTDKGNNAYDEFNEVVRGLARMFSNVYVIDLFKHAPLYDADFQDRYYVGGHLNAMGYEYTARVFMTYIDWIIRNNYKEFKEVAFIGTKLHYTPDNELKKKK